MLIKCLPKLVFVIFMVQLSSCTTFKTSNYNKQTRIYSNYKMNYSVKIPENYSFVEKADNLDLFSKAFFSINGGKIDAIMSYKHYPILFTFFVKKEISDDLKKKLDKSFREKKSISELMLSFANQDIYKESLQAAWDLQLTKMNLKPTPIHISSQGEYLIISMFIKTQLLDFHANVAITYFKQNQSSNEYYSFNTVGINFPASTSIAHEDLIKFIKKVDLGTYLLKDRYKSN